MKNRSVISVSILLVTLSLFIFISGCSTMLGSAIGKENAQAVILLEECKHEEALKILRQAKLMGNSEHRFISLYMEATALMELGRESESTDLYQEILNTPEAKEDGLTREKLDKEIRDTASQSPCKS